MKKRLFILFGLLFVLYVAFVGNAYASPCTVCDPPASRYISAQEQCDEEQPVTLRDSDRIKKAKQRTRIWTQFFCFILPGQQILPARRLFASAGQQLYDTRIVLVCPHNNLGFRGPPAFGFPSA